MVVRRGRGGACWLHLMRPLCLQMRKRREFLKMKREEAKQEEGAQVAIPAPDPPLPPTFDADTNCPPLPLSGGHLAAWLARCSGLLLPHLNAP